MDERDEGVPPDEPESGGGPDGGGGTTAEGEGGQLRVTVPNGAGARARRGRRFAGLDGEDLEARPTKHRDAQMKRRPRRKLFDKAAKEAFLGWYAASGNCVWAAERAGFDDGTVWRHRAQDPGFAARFDEAQDQGLRRAKVRMLEKKPAKYEIDGGREVPDFEFDPEMALRLIATRERAGAQGEPRLRQRGRRPRIATNAEIEEALVKRLVAYGRRVKQTRQAPGGDDEAGGMPPPAGSAP